MILCSREKSDPRVQSNEKLPLQGFFKFETNCMADEAGTVSAEMIPCEWVMAPGIRSNISPGEAPALNTARY